MAWMCSATTNEGLITALKGYKIIRSQLVERVLRNVDRGFYSAMNAYEDAPQSIGFGVTISAPHIHAEALELLKEYLQPGMRALDVGSGSGFMSACFAQMCGKVVGIEYLKELVKISKENIMRDPESRALLQSGAIEIYHGDGWKGYPPLAPYNAIYVGAAASDIPEALIEQLATPGRMVIPIGHPHSAQYLMKIDKTADGKIIKEILAGVAFVPLVRAHHGEFPEPAGKPTAST